MRRILYCVGIQQAIPVQHLACMTRLKTTINTVQGKRQTMLLHFLKLNIYPFPVYCCAEAKWHSEKNSVVLNSHRVEELFLSLLFWGCMRSESGLDGRRYCRHTETTHIQTILDYTPHTPVKEEKRPNASGPISRGAHFSFVTLPFSV